MTAGKEHFLGNCEHLGVNGLALHPGCLYSNAPNINQFRKNRKKYQIYQHILVSF